MGSPKNFKFSSNSLTEFKCLAQDCPDTCCHGWGMQVNNSIKNLYNNHGTELASALFIEGDQIIMKRDDTSDYCVKFSNGLCGVQSKFGENFLADACYFYPKVIRKLDNIMIESAALSCPEALRLLLKENNFAYEKKIAEKLPENLKSYSDDIQDSYSYFNIHEKFISFLNQNKPAEELLSIILNVSYSLNNIEPKIWVDALDFLLPTAKERVIKAENDINNPYKLITALLVLLKASKKTQRTRLIEVLDNIANVLDLKIDYNKCEIILNSGNISFEAQKNFISPNIHSQISNLLRKYLQGQLALNFFPYAGLGDNIKERIILTVFKFALIKVALICNVEADGKILMIDNAIKVIQSISKFVDHLTDSKLIFIILNDYNWHREPCIEGLINI